MNKCRNAVLFLLAMTIFTSESKALWSVKDSLYRAASSYDIGTINNYLQRGYSIDTADSDGVTALCEAYWKNNSQAYNVLLQYGANPNANCMYQKPTSNLKPYLYGGAAVAVTGGIIAIAASSGGGGSSSNDSKDDKDNNAPIPDDTPTPGDDTPTPGDDTPTPGDDTPTPGDDTPTPGDDTPTPGDDTPTPGDDTPTPGDDTPTPGDDTPSSGDDIPMHEVNFVPYAREYFQNNKEYNADNFTNSVNFLEAINAATAYSKFYGLDKDGKEVNLLKENVLVAVLDNGVWFNHAELRDENNYKKVVFGYNFDYGPCLNGKSKNCWKYTGNQRMELTTDNGKSACKISREEYDKWKASYPSDYDWDKQQDNYNPVDTTDLRDLHGSNVAGIIAASKDDSGMMGVGFTNIYLNVVRWDMASTMIDPIRAILADKYDDKGVFAINMSIGSDAKDSSNASLVSSGRMLQGFEDSASEIMKKYTIRTIFGEDRKTIDGPIIVKAAGNEYYDQPDIESGIKNLNKYKELLMLVVVSADVELNDDGTVKSYSKSEFSNKCGVTSRYCIAAPGGNSKTGEDILSLGKPNRYSRMQGTSQATPVVTGALAFIKAAFPDMDSSEIIELVRVTANTNGEGYNSDNHTDSTYGAGLLDLGAAVTTYIPAEGNSVTTVSGNTVDSTKIRLDNAIMSVPAGMSAALQKALPETITAFDKYRRPFEFSTTSYIAQTHSGYKSFKNDVAHISPNHKIKRMEQKNMTFAYAESSAPKKGNGFMYAEYNSGKNVSGFYFSEDTKYYSENNSPADFANPFMAFNNAYGMQHTYNLNSLLGFKFETVSGQNGIYDGDRDYRDRSFDKPAYAFNSEISLHNNKQFALALSSGMLYEQEAMLGLNGEGAFDVADTQTYHAGVKATWFATPKITLSGSYYQGYTKGQSLAAGMLRSSNLISDSFAFDLNYKQNNSFDYGLRLSSPLRVKHGRLYVDMASGRDYDSGMVLRNRYVAGLKPERREYKFALYANKDVTDSLSWSSEFDVRLNPEHQAASADYRALFGLSYKF